MATFRSESGKEVYNDSKKRTLLIDGVQYKRQPKPRPKSRNDRRGDAVSALQQLQSTLEELREQAENVDFTAKGAKGELKEIAKGAGENASMVEASEVEELSIEMGNWRDNMQGTNLESTSKYEAVNDAADALESIVSELEGLSFDFTYDETEDAENNKEALIDAITQTVELLEESIGELENVEFPGMFG